MLLPKETQQRKEFCNILFELAKSQELLEDAHYRSNIYKRLEVLYDADNPEKQFRHFYSDIFSVLSQIRQNANLGDINILSQNLDMIRNGYRPQNKADDGIRTIDISDSIRKLYDHVSLDVARITYSDAADRQISGKSSLENLQGQINSLYDETRKAQEIKTEYENIRKKISSVEDKLDSSQKEYITILGIFASIVLAFTGGIAFSTSVLNNIARSSIYRIIIVSLIIGAVFLNMLFGLLYYLNTLVNKAKKLFPIITSNIIIFILIVVTILFWNYGFVEKRNSRIITHSIESTERTDGKINELEK